MKILALGKSLQQFISTIVQEVTESNEVELGFDAMLSHDVVTFLRTDHSISKPLIERSIFIPDALFLLDEHELAMV